ncbi:glycosyltransferase family 1 protein [Serpula lacrymans var. lacrymans S7.3]|uniref:UDP-N-acetylglucosamine transferase subunit ALG14 n=2 Tax=Serpula lacrymans var. lacrymans TaxID=341189 RepID=F8PW20_SERL3|nr:glycosyltransferase family 1 protein [Serpula lacrymans var. lacrymans S7.9]EGN99879.1 glycosyltransferase family 1 protein [Serpula lacrymans var. lacrymans S7.3]EGO25448.1 glycosyltransferase family 1 protein [Serpula lacrymans var. lacrymans S7.9]
MGWYTAAVCTIVLLVLLRIYMILPGNPRGKRSLGSVVRRPSTDTCSLAIFLGSGGHTSEVLSLASALDFSRYSPRTYLISEGDTLSIQKAVSLETLKSADTSKLQGRSQCVLLTVPRARRVHQSLLMTPPTALLSLLSCVYHVTITPLLRTERFRRPFADVLILNGPGTCVILCAAVFLNKFLGLPAPKLIYIESFARVRSLSFSGKLLRPWVDCFIVQWPDLIQGQGRERYHGWLV